MFENIRYESSIAYPMLKRKQKQKEKELREKVEVWRVEGKESKKLKKLGASEKF
jgi:hypothetical protein